MCQKWALNDPETPANFVWIHACILKLQEELWTFCSPPIILIFINTLPQVSAQNVSTLAMNSWRNALDYSYNMSTLWLR